MRSDAKETANDIRRNASQIRPAIQLAFEKAILGAGGEVQFIKNLLAELQTTFRQLANQGYPFSCRVSQVHHKPIVKIVKTGSRCELGDILVVVKYHLSGGVREKNSILKKAVGSALDTGQLTNAGTGVRSQHFKNIFNPLGRIWWKR
jgi:hypothetical protein